MDVIRLRTLTRKSKIGWGCCRDNTVQQLLDTNKKQIAWLYYHVEWMTFTPDILDEMGIKNGWDIPKPGTDTAKFEIRAKRFIEFKYGKKIAGAVIARKRNKQAKHRAYIADQEANLPKSRLQAINHGNLRPDMP